MSTWLTGAADGALFLLQSALALAAVAASALLLWGAGVRHALVAAVLFAAVAVLTVWLPPLRVDIVAPAVVAACGLLLAIGWDWPMPVRAAACAAGALAAGLAGGIQTATWAEAGGAALVLAGLFFALLLPAHFIAPRIRSAAAFHLARRMAGAWIAAVGVLLLVLALRGVSLGG